MEEIDKCSTVSERTVMVHAQRAMECRKGPYSSNITSIQSIVSKGEVKNMLL